jgi:hypothetical protein
MILKVYEVDPGGKVRLISGAFWRRDGLKQIFPRPQPFLDISLSRHLHFLMMVRGVNCHKEVHSAGAAKKEIL